MAYHCRTQRRFRNEALAVVSFLLVAWASPLQAADLPKEAKRALLDAKWEQALDALDDINLIEAGAPCRLVAAHGCLATNRNNKALLLLLTVKPEDVKLWSAWTEKLAEAHPASAVACYLRGDALARSGNVAEADLWFSRAITHDPKLGLARVGRGMVRALAGRKDEAYIDLLEATDAEPDLAEAHASLGCAEIAMHNASGALEALNEALRINPDFALAYNGRGCANYGLGRPDEAADDFRAAERLFPALAVTTTMNETFVEAMVSAKVDQVLGGKAGAGTTIKSRMETLSSPPGRDGASLTDPEFSRPVGRAGLDAKYDALSAERRELLEQLSRATSGVNREAGAGAEAAWQMYQLEWAKQGVNVIITAATFGENLAAQGAKTALKEVAPRIGEAALKTVVSPAMEKIPGASGRVVRTGIGGVNFTDGMIDPAGLLFTIAQEDRRSVSVEHFGKADQFSREAGQIIKKVIRNQQALEQAGAERIMRGDYNANSRKFTPDEQIRNALIVSNSPWRQMPKLVEQVQGMANNGGLVAIVGDTMMATGVQRALENKGVPTLSLPSLDKAKLDTLNRNISPSAVVGFKPTDTDRYKVPFFPGGPGRSGAGIGSAPALDGKFPGDPPRYSGAIAAHDPVRDVVAYMLATDDDTKYLPWPGGGGMMMPIGRTFPPDPPDDDGGGGGGGGFTGRSGPPRFGPDATGLRPIDRIPSMHNRPGTWNWGRNWAPPGDAGGVDSNMDWVFVDKGDWPVATFFTLAYDVPILDRAAPEERD